MRVTKKSLLSYTQRCRKCRCLPYKAKAQTDRKKAPFYPRYNVITSNREVLFLAESPPYSRDYFYGKSKTSKPKTTSSELFDILLSLGIIEDCTLEAFKKRQYFTDVVKCPFIANGKGQKPPIAAISNCQEILRMEIELTNPSLICAMGTKALRGVLKEKMKLSGVNGRVILPRHLSDKFNLRSRQVKGPELVQSFLGESFSPIVMAHHPTSTSPRKEEGFQLLAAIMRSRDFRSGF